MKVDKTYPYLTLEIKHSPNLVLDSSQKKRELLDSVSRIESALRLSDLKAIREECIYLRGIFS